MHKTVLITGASRGIGRATALLFAKAGWRVGIGYHQNRDAAESLLAELTALGADADIFAADVADRQAATAMVAAAKARFGHIDALICNAGITRSHLFTDVTEADWREMMGVTLDGPFFCAQAAVSDMIRRQDGVILFVSSIWGLTGASCEAPYSAAKAGLIGLTKALAKELGPSHIRVNCVAPGVIDTDMNAHLSEDIRAELAAETPLGRIGTPDDIAHSLLFLASDDASFITGQVLSPNGGIVI